MKTLQDIEQELQNLKIQDTNERLFISKLSFIALISVVMEIVFSILFSVVPMLSPILFILMVLCLSVVIYCIIVGNSSFNKLETLAVKAHKLYIKWTKHDDAHEQHSRFEDVLDIFYKDTPQQYIKYFSMKL